MMSDKAKDYTENAVYIIFLFLLAIIEMSGFIVLILISSCINIFFSYSLIALWFLSKFITLRIERKIAVELEESTRKLANMAVEQSERFKQYVKDRT